MELDLRLIDIAIVVFSTLAVVCIVLAAIRLAWTKRKHRTSIDDERRALRRWQNHRPPIHDTDQEPTSSDDFRLER